ncbi:MAG: glycosyltransferase family 2 protein [Proteobacteria bacterium]|nr:glycosyltransferase family 2 protein [Pseudomonadota bacterium]MBU1714540.1 glycosyltransferase family 2 protein [Pseudomonadota bacterium]
MPDNITILLPAYNEEQSIGETVKAIKKLHPGFEVLVVDDGSTDDTAKIAKEAGANVWQHPYNIGNGAAIKTGLRYANGDWIVMMDADGQHNPAEINALLSHKDHYDMVIGARSKGSNTSLHRDLANFIYNRLASYITKFKIEDLTSGFRLVRKATAKKFIYLLPNSFSYPTTLTMSYLRSGRSIKYVPIQTKARQGKSKIKLIQDGVRFLLIITRIATLFSPLRVFLPISLFFFYTGLGYYLYTFFKFSRFTNMSALLLTTSVIIFMMGMVSEQITQMRNDRTED